MRFKRYARSEFVDTPRKRAAALRRQAKEREALPLFADQIAEEQPAVDDIMSARAESYRIREIRDREHRAAQWRKGRLWLRRYQEPERLQLLRFWNLHRWFPGDPVYLLDMLNMYDTDRLNLEAPGVLREE